MRLPPLAIVLCCVPWLSLAQGPEPEDVKFLRSVLVEKGQTAPGDVICILCSITVHGAVSGDVIAIGGDIEVSGTVTGDVVAAGGRIQLLPGARTDGDVVAVGGSVTATSQPRPPAEHTALPYFHLPGQRSFHPIGVLTLAGFMLLVTILAGAIVRSAQAGRLADVLTRRWWLALLLGLAGWILYFLSEEQLDVEGTLQTVATWLVTGLLLALTLIGYAGLTWLVGKRLARQDGWKAWAVGGLVLTAGLLVPVVGAFVGSLLLFAALGSGIERTAGLGITIVGRLRGRTT